MAVFLTAVFITICFLQITHMPVQLLTYGQGEEGQESTSITSPYSFPVPNATSFILPSLTPYTNYSITVCATTIVGCGNATYTEGLTNEDGRYSIKQYCLLDIMYTHPFSSPGPH